MSYVTGKVVGVWGRKITILSDGDNDSYPEIGDEADLSTHSPECGCGFWKDSPRHGPAMGCKEDGVLCDKPWEHHTYYPAK